MSISNNNQTITRTTTFNAHLNTYLRLFFLLRKKKVCLSVLGAVKTDNGYNARCMLFCSAMIDTCAKWTTLMNRPENNFQHFNFL